MSEWAMLEIYCFCYYVSKFMAFSAQKFLKVFRASNWNPKNCFFQPLAAAEGYSPDAFVTSDEVVTARPSPSMIYLNMVRWVSWVFQPCNGLSAGHGGSGFESPQFFFLSVPTFFICGVIMICSFKEVHLFFRWRESYKSPTSLRGPTTSFYD